MGLTINEKSKNTGPRTFYEERFIQIIEDHLAFLRNHEESQLMSIEPAMAYRFEHDIYGLLTHLKIPKRWHYAIMRANKLTSPTEYREDMLTLLIPSERVLNRIHERYRTHFVSE